ncbi:MAG: hypothetical protein M3Y12_07890 [Bacteroidota bacterium]|nr:hypothetical protein [Bacteroidota bacterium]
MDKEILLEWATNASLHLMLQDEELFLADENYVELMLDVLDNCEILPTKKEVIIEAMCVIIYDNLHEENQEADKDLVQKIRNELLSRKQLVIAAEHGIMNYIKEVVFPVLGISYKAK